MYTVV